MAAKQKNGTGFYVAVVVLCLAACAVLIYAIFFGGSGAGVFGDPVAAVPRVTPNAAVGGTPVALDERQLETMIRSAAPAELGLDDVHVEVREDGLRLSGTLEKQGLLSLLESSDQGAALIARGVVSLMPEELALGAGLGVEEEDGGLHLTPQSVSFGGVTVDAALLPEPLLEPIQDALDDAVRASGGHITGVALQDGLLTIGVQ